MLRRASHPRPGGVNQNGAIFLRHNALPEDQFHESLHSIHTRIAGKVNGFIDYYAFGSRLKNHADRYYEGILIPYVKRLFSN